MRLWRERTAKSSDRKSTKSCGEGTTVLTPGYEVVPVISEWN